MWRLIHWLGTYGTGCGTGELWEQAGTHPHHMQSGGVEAQAGRVEERLAGRRLRDPDFSLVLKVAVTDRAKRRVLRGLSDSRGFGQCRAGGENRQAAASVGSEIAALVSWWDAFIEVKSSENLAGVAAIERFSPGVGAGCLPAVGELR
jgi:hypothetical protein